MNAFLKNSLVLLVTAFLSSNAFAEDPKEKDTRPVVVGFFNGMRNTYHEANQNLEALKKLISTSPKMKGRAIPDAENGYELFYNQSEGFTEDLFEVFAQKYKELGLSVNGDVSSFTEIFMALLLSDLRSDDVITLSDPTDPKQPIITLTDELKGGFDWTVFARDAVKALINKHLIKLVKDGEGITARVDYLIHAKQMSELLETNNKLFLVSHSQGALFLNKAYETVVGGKKAKYPHMQAFVQAYYVAPAADPNKLIQYHYKPATYGEQIVNYTLLDNDITIRGLGAAFPIATPNISGKGGDSFNHGFIETYLKDGSLAKDKVESDIAIYLNDFSRTVNLALILPSYTIVFHPGASTRFEWEAQFRYDFAVQEPPSKDFPDGNFFTSFDDGQYGFYPINDIIDSWTGYKYWQRTLSYGIGTVFYPAREDTNEDEEYEFKVYLVIKPATSNWFYEEKMLVLRLQTVSLEVNKNIEIPNRKSRICIPQDEYSHDYKKACPLQESDLIHILTARIRYKNYGVTLPSIIIE